MKFHLLIIVLFIIFYFIIIYSLKKVEKVTTLNGLNNKEGIYYLTVLKRLEQDHTSLSYPLCLFITFGQLSSEASSVFVVSSTSKCLFFIARNSFIGKTFLSRQVQEKSQKSQADQGGLS